MFIDIIIENAVEVAAALLMMLIGVLGTWLSVKLGKQQELKSIAAAINEAVAMARLTVDELQQTIVDGLKAERADGKLTAQDIKNLSTILLEKTKQKMSASAVELLRAANVDLRGLIQGAGEAWISKLKQG